MAVGSRVAFCLSEKSPSLQDLTSPWCPWMCLMCAWEMLSISFAASDTQVALEPWLGLSTAS